MGEICPLRVGVIGCGMISEVYLRNCRASPMLEVAACADVDPARAEQRAAQFGVPRACTVEELLADETIEAVLNLTIPAAHAAVSLAALDAGKHVYSEKPLATTRDDGRRILEAAAERDLLVGCAPDTFFGEGLQIARRLIDDGHIGEPVAALTGYASHGHESWHPDPAFFYQPGAGPLFDMGPYHLTGLTALLGPVRRVSAAAHAAFAERTITSEPLHGRRITVRTPTHVAGTLEFAGGAIATLIESFDLWAHSLPPFEVYGTEGSLRVRAPFSYRGPTWLWRPKWNEWCAITSDSPYTADNRGVGLEDMAGAIRSGTPFRATGQLAFHVLDVMQSLLDSAAGERHLEIGSTVQRPAPLPLTLSGEA